MADYYLLCFFPEICLIFRQFVRFIFQGFQNIYFQKIFHENAETPEIEFLYMLVESSFIASFLYCRRYFQKSTLKKILTLASYIIWI